MEELCELFAKLNITPKRVPAPKSKPLSGHPVSYRAVKKIFVSKTYGTLPITNKALDLLVQNLLKQEILLARSFFTNLYRKDPDYAYIDCDLLLDAFPIAKRLACVPRAEIMGISDGFKLIHFIVKTIPQEFKFTLSFLNKVAQLLEAYLFIIKYNITRLLEDDETVEDIMGTLSPQDIMFRFK